MDMPFLIRQPGIIKQANSALTRKEDKYAESIRQRPTISINLSYKNLLQFPYHFEQVETHTIASLNLDCNSIKQFVFNTAYFPNLATLSVQYNNVNKVQIKSLSPYNCWLTHMNLSHNNMEFLDLSSLVSLKQLRLSHNNLSTIILPQSHLTTLDISYNTFSNIQYSVLSSKVFSKLVTIDVSHNKRSLYDLILAVEQIQLLPNLRQLNCGYNVISYFEHLPPDLEVLNLESNELVFDRRTLNQLIRLKKLRELTLTGNVISHNFLDILQSKKKQTKCIIKSEKGSEDSYQQSPYRVYQYSPNEQAQQLSNTHKNIKVQSRKNDRNFTLGEEASIDEENIDPYYLLIQQTPKLHEETLQQNQHQITEESEKDNIVLKEMENKLKSNKFKVKVQGVRYMNHYKLYFDKLAEFMVVPPQPVSHADRNANISLRIDPPDDADYLNQHPLLNEMLKCRGGIHYLRKVYNWTVTQQTMGASSQISIMFINIELSKQQFQSICNGSYEKIDEAIKSKHTLNQQPSSFTCFHILGRLSMDQTVRWSCLYLIEALHL